MTHNGGTNGSQDSHRTTLLHRGRDTSSPNSGNTSLLPGNPTDALPPAWRTAPPHPVAIPSGGIVYHTLGDELTADPARISDLQDTATAFVPGAAETSVHIPRDTAEIEIPQTDTLPDITPILRNALDRRTFNPNGRMRLNTETGAHHHPFTVNHALRVQAAPPTAAEPSPADSQGPFSEAGTRPAIKPMGKILPAYLRQGDTEPHR